MCPPVSRFPSRVQPMLDVLFLAAGIVFFIVTAAYADGCDRL